MTLRARSLVDRIDVKHESPSIIGFFYLSVPVNLAERPMRSPDSLIIPPTYGYAQVT